MKRPEPLSESELFAWLSEHEGWDVRSRQLTRRFAVPYELGVRILDETAVDVARLDHHPKVTLEYGGLTVVLWTHDKDSITELDLRVAEAFDESARRTDAAR